MIPTTPTGVFIYTALYALICAAIFLRVMLFDRKGGEYRALPAWMAWLLCVLSGSIPLRFLFGGIPVPDPAAFGLALFLLCAVINTRGSVHHLLPRGKPSSTDHARDIYRRYQP
ncbi:phage holin family protein [Aeromonas veronii]|uniref:phage holin family protein n=1 Tax=Aeromonas veronii TaxID=654 RepID=UPI002DB764B8|nr:phage holin family protein [Aeromonas veronii]MEB5667406.1 phage holin family protein [Aeromonas veronii]